MAQVSLRRAKPADLAAINKVIESAVMQWNLPDRVKRLALPSYRYNEFDFSQLAMFVAVNEQNEVVGVMSLEETRDEHLAPNQNILLLHGLYVEPEYQHQGIGTRLYDLAQQQVVEPGHAGLLVRAQNEAVGFFRSRGMQQLPDRAGESQYAHRFWKSCERT